MMSILVDCEWGGWVEGDCSTTCGTGQKINTRTKLIEEAYGGNCTGESTEVLSCLLVECPGMYLSLTTDKKYTLFVVAVNMFCTCI